jgi:hypothetical protein
MCTGKQPSVKRLHAFCCPIVVRYLVKWPTKLDLNTSVGTFLGYTATEKNIVYMDSITKHFKTATHVIFDEADMTLPPTELMPAAELCNKLGLESTPQLIQMLITMTKVIQWYRNLIQLPSKSLMTLRLSFYLLMQHYLQGLLMVQLAMIYTVQLTW